jgi:hypothetical protein
MSVSSKFLKIISKLKQLGLAYTVTWKERTVTDVFDGTTQEPQVSWSEGTEIDAIIRPVSATEVFDDLKASEELMRIYTPSAIKYLDRIVWGSKIFEIQPVESKTGYYVALLKRLVIE